MHHNGGMPAPLARTVIDIVDRPFHAIWTPEDGVLRAAGFATDVDPQTDTLVQRLAALAPELVSRGIVDTPHGHIADALRAYDAGDVAALDTLSVAQPETPFRAEVWRALRRVPADRPVTYTELATLAGRPAAVRAAASGCANNLIALVVPCHRIVRADGGLGGYLFGTDIKERLLRHEAAA